MTYRPLQPGDKGIDFAYQPDPKGYPGIAANGARFVCRYSAGTASTLEKCAKPGEIDAAVKAGVDFWANFELAENTPELGARPGRAHGAADKAFWASRGLAPKAGIIVSWEPGNQQSKWPEVAAFLEAYRSATGRPLGLYAGLPSLMHFRKLGLVDVTWLPMSSSASGLDTSQCKTQAEYAAFMEKVARDNGITLCQNRNRWYGSGADEDVLITVPSVPFSHLEALHATPNPTPKPSPTPNLDMGPTVEAIMALDRTSPEYQALLADIAQAVATYQVTIPKKGKWSIRTTLASIWQHAKAADK